MGEVSITGVRIGCSGWQYRDWREVLYPKGLPQRRWLERYAEAFDTVEVNSTFYRLARPKAVAAWLEQTPPEFVFALKASRYLIHMRKLQGIDEGIKRFYESIEPLVPMAAAGMVQARRRAPGGRARRAPGRAPRLRVPPPHLVHR